MKSGDHEKEKKEADKNTRQSVEPSARTAFCEIALAGARLQHSIRRGFEGLWRARTESGIHRPRFESSGGAQPADLYFGDSQRHGAILWFRCA